MGYEGRTVEDKIRNGLNDLLSLEWAKVAQKPRDVADQLAMLRDMGHALEDALRPGIKRFKMLGAPGQTQSQEGKGQGQGQGQKGGGNGNGQGKGQGKGQGQGQGKGGQQKKGGSGKKKEWKDPKVHLKGIPKDILDERFKNENCKKCGKHGHLWTNCFTKEPVTSRVAGGAKRGHGDEDSGEGSSGKKAKIEEARPVAASGRIIEIPDDIGDDYDLYAL